MYVRFVDLVTTKHLNSGIKMESEIDIHRKRLGIIINPKRIHICRVLYPNESMYTSQLHEITGIKRPDIGFHLMILHEAGILKTEFKVIKQPTKEDPNGKAGAFYSFTDEGKMLFEYVRDTIQQAFAGEIIVTKPRCVNPHEMAYRGCTDQCRFWEKCSAKKEA